MNNPHNSPNPNPTPSVTEEMMSAGARAMDGWSGPHHARRELARKVYLAMKSSAPQHTGLTDVERDELVEFQVAARFIADEYAGTIRPKQSEQLYRMSALLAKIAAMQQPVCAVELARHVAAILEEWDMKEPPNPYTGHAYKDIARDIINRAALLVSNRSGVERMREAFYEGFYSAEANSSSVAWHWENSASKAALDTPEEGSKYERLHHRQSKLEGRDDG